MKPWMRAWLGGTMLASLALCVHAQEVKPGLWEDKVSYIINGEPLVLPDERGRPISTIVSTGCVASKDAGDVRALIERNMIKDMHGCRLSRWNYALGTLKVAVSCDDSARGGSGTLEGSGPLTASHYDISVAGHSQSPQTGPMAISVRYQGRYLGACKSS